MSLDISDSTVKTHSRTLGVLFFLSSCVAVLGFTLPWAPAGSFSNTVGEQPSVWLSIVWLSLFAVALVKFRKRGLWLLVGAPLALLWPFLTLYCLGGCD